MHKQTHLVQRTAFAGVILLSLAGAPALAQTPAASAPAAAASSAPAAPSMQINVVRQGSGAKPQAGQVVIAHYRGTLADGKEFDSSYKRNLPFAFTLGRRQVIKGWDEGFAQLRVGDKATFVIPPNLAYGERQRGPIPANSTLYFEVELLDIKPSALADMLGDTIDAEGLEAGQRRFTTLRAVKFGDAYVSESQLNGLGYRYMGKDKLPEALAVLQWTVQLFPNSGNVYDSLGEVQLKAGQREAAKASYEKSLALDPTNDNARKVLKDLQGPAPAK